MAKAGEAVNGGSRRRLRYPGTLPECPFSEVDVVERPREVTTPDDRICARVEQHGRGWRTNSTLGVADELLENAHYEAGFGPSVLTNIIMMAEQADAEPQEVKRRKQSNGYPSGREALESYLGQLPELMAL